MKAITFERYGPPDVLRYREIDKPAYNDDTVLIKVHAASVNPIDFHFMRGTPYFLRMMTGLNKPKFRQLGSDMSGVVESAGKSVTRFKPGDEVFGGILRGSFAEYARASESDLAIKPAEITFEQAASLPVAGSTALQSLRNGRKAQAGTKVLINGAAGGVGTFAVQIAAFFGAHVTGVCSAKNAEFVRSLGADRVIDYTRTDFTQEGKRYDILLDCIGNHSISSCRRLLSPNGRHLLIGGPNEKWMIGTMVRSGAGIVSSQFTSRKVVFVLARSNKDDLTLLADLVRSGKIKPVIDRRHSLQEVPEAIRYLETSRARGKILIHVD